MWQPLELPYFKDSTYLPGPLPTTQEIEASNMVFLDHGHRKVVVVGKDFLVKYGPSVSQNEGEVLVFLEENLPAVPAPRLYATYRKDNAVYLIMQ